MIESKSLSEKLFKDVLTADKRR